MKTIAKFAVFVTLIAASLALAACSGATTPTATQTPTPSKLPTPTVRTEKQVGFSEVLTKGAELYTANCQSCHGDREGKWATAGVPPHNERGHTWHHPDAQLKEWVLNGKIPGLMPGFKDKLTEGDVDSVLTYIKTWWTEEQRQSQADISRRYQEALDKQKNSGDPSRHNLPLRVVEAFDRPGGRHTFL